MLEPIQLGCEFHNSWCTNELYSSKNWSNGTRRNLTQFFQTHCNATVKNPVLLHKHNLAREKSPRTERSTTCVSVRRCSRPQLGESCKRGSWSWSCIFVELWMGLRSDIFRKMADEKMAMGKPLPKEEVEFVLIGAGGHFFLLPRLLSGLRCCFPFWGVNPSAGTMSTYCALEMIFPGKCHHMARCSSYIQWVSEWVTHSKKLQDYLGIFRVI